ncbi:hypothetical protein BJ170DRAFT_415416 [Xylariales sp. AK1849]|nr:hypothetical protein BJ170DRAFT_415416 [Xylariales sp. AK1849]
MSSKHAWKVELIPWDPFSPEHVERAYEQRLACGWAAETVHSYAEAGKKGGIVYYWVVLADALPDRDELLERHIKAYPRETAALRDTAEEIRATPREPTGTQFHPIGHVALDIHDPEAYRKLGLPGEGVVYVHQLYVSYALHKGGFGAAAMSQVAVVAAKEPMNARMLALDAISEDIQFRPDFLNAGYHNKGIPVPNRSTQSWYIQQGWEVFGRTEEGYLWNPEPGKTARFPIVYLRKPIS